MQTHFQSFYAQAQGLSLRTSSSQGPQLKVTLTRDGDTLGCDSPNVIIADEQPTLLIHMLNVCMSLPSPIEHVPDKL